MKKILWLLCAFSNIFAANAFAEIICSADGNAPTPYSCCCYVPYFGAHTGFVTGNWRVQDIERVTHFFPHHNYLIGIFGGLGATIRPNFWTAGEIFYNQGSVGSHTNLINDGTAAVRIQSHYGYGISFIPGIEVYCGTLLYLRLGLSATQFEFQQIADGESSSSSHHVFGQHFGFGIQRTLFGKLALRAEYVYTNYSPFTAFGNKVSPQDNQINLGLVVRFM